MLLLTGQVGIGLRALFTPKVLYSSEIIDGKKNFCNGHTVGILLFRRSGGGGIGMFRLLRDSIVIKQIFI